MTKNVEAYDCYLRGRDYYDRSTREANLLAHQLFTKAIALDPHFASAHVYVGWTYFTQWSLGWSQDPQVLDLALAAAQQAIAADPLLSDGHRLLGIVYLWKKQYDLAVAEIERALALDPNCADTYCALGDIFNFSGRPAETPELVEKAMRLNPRADCVYSKHT